MQNKAPERIYMPERYAGKDGPFFRVVLDRETRPSDIPYIRADLVDLWLKRADDAIEAERTQRKACENTMTRQAEMIQGLKEKRNE